MQYCSVCYWSLKRFELHSFKMNRENINFYKLIPTNFHHQAKEFFSNSTLHGVRYIAEKGRPFGEKFMWFCCVAIGAVAAFVIIDSLWEKFQTNPTITGEFVSTISSSCTSVFGFSVH